MHTKKVRTGEPGARTLSCLSVSAPHALGCTGLKAALALLLQVLVKKREDADDVLGLSAAKRGAKGKGKRGAAARVADKASVRASASWQPPWCQDRHPQHTACQLLCTLGRVPGASEGFPVAFG